MIHHTASRVHSKIFNEGIPVTQMIQASQGIIRSLLKLLRPRQLFLLASKGVCDS